MSNLNEAIIHRDLMKSLNESEEIQKNKRPEGIEEWTFADWAGRDMSGETYDGDITCWDILSSLEGAPKIVNGNFVYLGGGTLGSKTKHLTSLKGAPEKVTGNFEFHFGFVKSLIGAPEKVGGDFDCANNKITSLEGAPKEVGGDFDCSGNKLKSLIGAPEKVGGDFDCHDTVITSLEGAPKKIGGNFVHYENNKLISLIGAPKEVGGNFVCHSDSLTSLEGAPKEVRGKFDCSITQPIDNDITKEASAYTSQKTKEKKSLTHYDLNNYDNVEIIVYYKNKPYSVTKWVDKGAGENIAQKIGNNATANVDMETNSYDGYSVTDAEGYSLYDFEELTGILRKKLIFGCEKKYFNN